MECIYWSCIVLSFILAITLPDKYRLFLPLTVIIMMNFVSSSLLLTITVECQLVFTVILLLSAMVNFYVEEQNEESIRVLHRIAATTEVPIEIVMMQYEEIYLSDPKIAESAKLIKTGQYFSVDISMFNQSIFLA